MKNVLSNSDCEQLIALSEQMGYRPDMPEGQDDERAMGCVFLASDLLNNFIFDRCKEVLPIINQGPALGNSFPPNFPLVSPYKPPPLFPFSNPI